jgi:hypothetical protein
MLPSPRRNSNPPTEPTKHRPWNPFQCKPAKPLATDVDPTMADHADVVRLIHDDADPTVEAATRSRQSGVLQLLIDSGAAITAANYPVL